MSDQSLRDALEQMAAKYEREANGHGGTESYQYTARKLNDLLAAHPAEPAQVAADPHWVKPAPVVTEQLVSDTIRDSLAFENDMPRGHLLVQIANRAAHLLFQRGVVAEAAAPLLGPRAKPRPVEELVGVLTDPNWGKPLLDRDAVKAAVRGPIFTELGTYGRVVEKCTDAAMGLARPMPTREQAVRAVWDAYQKRIGVEATPFQHAEAFADALLALLNGAES